MLNFTTDLLDYDFVKTLQSEGRKLYVMQNVTCKKQWLLADAVNAEWERNGYEGEITKEDFYSECSRAINHGLPFPICAASGQTLRRWCEVTESYAKLPALEEFKEILSFDHFFQARRMANDDKYELPSPDIALAKAVQHKWTASEMVFHFSPKEPPHEYDKVIGLLDSLQSIKIDWIKDPERRKQAKYHLSQYRQIVEKR